MPEASRGPTAYRTGVGAPWLPWAILGSLIWNRACRRSPARAAEDSRTTTFPGGFTWDGW